MEKIKGNGSRWVMVSWVGVDGKKEEGSKEETRKVISFFLNRKCLPPIFLSMKNCFTFLAKTNNGKIIEKRKIIFHEKNT